MYDRDHPDHGARVAFATLDGACVTGVVVGVDCLSPDGDHLTEADARWLLMDDGGEELLYYRKREAFSLLADRQEQR